MRLFANPIESVRKTRTVPLDPVDAFDVIAWDPPHRFVLAWHPSVEPDATTILEVRFSPASGGGTEVELEHRGWEVFGAEHGDVARAGYQSGWDVVLEPFENGSAVLSGSSEPSP